jgi:hypothetical protein
MKPLYTVLLGAKNVELYRQENIIGGNIITRFHCSSKAARKDKTVKSNTQCSAQNDKTETSLSHHSPLPFISTLTCNTFAKRFKGTNHFTFSYIPYMSSEMSDMLNLTGFVITELVRVSYLLSRL